MRRNIIAVGTVFMVTFHVLFLLIMYFRFLARYVQGLATAEWVEHVAIGTVASSAIMALMAAFAYAVWLHEKKE